MIHLKRSAVPTVFAITGRGKLARPTPETEPMATVTDTPAAVDTPKALAARTAGSLLPGSVIGTLVFLATAVAAGYASHVVGQMKLPYIELFQIFSFLAVLALGVWLAGRAAATNAAHGVRGGIFLGITVLLSTFFLATAAWANSAMSTPLQVLTGLVVAAGVYLTFWLFSSKGGQKTCVRVEEQGWPMLSGYKPNQGLKARRYTMIGIMGIGITGAMAIYAANVLPGGSLVAKLPFLGTPVTLVPNANVTIPLLIALSSIFLAWRLVNVPDFGDFLINTEAEMNKVSWMTRKRLIQDTIVVLICVILMTAFLLFIDLFWGWLLSNKFINVLPNRDTPTKTGEAVDISTEW